MSLLMFESFDAWGPGFLYTYNPQWGWGGSSSWVYFNVAGGRRSSNCMKIGSNTAYYSSYNLNTVQSSLIIGFAIYPTSYSAVNGMFLNIVNASGQVQFVVDCTLAGRVRIKTAEAGSILAQSADGAITFNIYQYFEIKFTCTGSGDTVRVRVNGIDVIPSTGGLNLRQSGSGNASQIRWYSISNGAMTYYDDIYCENLSGVKYNDFLGDVKIDAFWPTADATYQQFTSNRPTHYDAINDNGDAALTYYIEEDTVTQKDSFTLTPVGDLPTIHAIGIRSVSRNSDIGVAQCTPFVRYGGVNYNQTPFNRGDTLQYDDTILTDRPDTGGALTKAFLQSMEFGWEFSAAS